MGADTDRGALRDGELQQAHSSLTVWRSPSDFHSAVEALHQRAPSKFLFNNPRLKFLIDAWTLAEFALRLRTVERVRLAGIKDGWPDGYVRTGGTTKNVEVTSVHLPGRRVGEEYKCDTGMEIEDDPVEDWIENANAIPTALDGAIRKKIAKRYAGASRCWLVVYLNLNDYGIRQKQSELAIVQVMQHHAGTFERLFVLWKDKLYWLRREDHDGKDLSALEL